MTDTTTTVANAVATVVAFMRSHKVKTIRQAYDLPGFPVGALSQALPGFEYPEISGLTSRQLSNRVECRVNTQRNWQALCAQDKPAQVEAEHSDGLHIHHDPGCSLCESERLADAAAVERAAATVADLQQVRQQLLAAAVMDLQGEQRWLLAANEQPTRRQDHLLVATHCHSRAEGYTRSAEAIADLIARLAR